MNLKELATHLRLSPTTVSRALNGYPEVSASTRERVRRAADELHYRPSHSARQLATGRSLVLGHVIAQSRHTLLGPLFADLMAGAGQAAGALGYDMHLRIVEDRDEEAFYRDVAASRRLDGVVVHGPLVHDPRIALLHDLGLPFIVHGRSAVDVPYAWLDVDNEGAMRRATALLLDLGHERVALLNGPESLHYAARRRDGFLGAHRERGLAPDATLMLSDVLSEDFGHAAVSAMLDQPSPPTAVVCAGLLPAWGALRAVHRRALVPGRDLSIVAYDDGISWLPNGPAAAVPAEPAAGSGAGGDAGVTRDGTSGGTMVGEPLLTAVRSSIREAGRRLVDHLVAAIERPGTPLVHETMPVDLVLGSSTGRPPSATPRRSA